MTFCATGDKRGKLKPVKRFARGNEFEPLGLA